LAVSDDISEEEEGGDDVRGDITHSSSREDGEDTNGNHADRDKQDGGVQVHASRSSNYAGVPAEAEPIAFGPVNAINEAIKQLSAGSLADLVSSSPMTSSTTVNHNTNQLISPSNNRTQEALTIIPKTTNEIVLLGALRESQEQETYLKQRVLELQAANILNEAYCSRLRGQLAHKEEKKANPKGKGKLMGDGLPCLLSGDWFYEWVVEFEAWQQREEREKEARLEAREERGEALVKWREQQEERKVAIAARRAEWETEKQVWETKKAAAKLAKKRFDRPKPLLGKLPPAIPRPKTSSAVEVDDDDDDDDDEEGNSENEP
jgi:hypothetical protein